LVAGDLEENTPEFAGGPLPAFGIARPDEHDVADLQQPTGRLAPKSLVRAGDQGNGHGPKYHRASESGSARRPAPGDATELVGLPQLAPLAG
jgi:hypothetical protein